MSADYHHYSAFGHRLASTLELPELRRDAPGTPHWRFRVVESLEPMRDPVALGDSCLYAEVHARLLRHAAGHRIVVDDTGSFDLSADGREIRWQPHADPWWDFGRNHLIGRVLATALHLEGVLTLHASAVAFDTGVVGFVAPKHVGKSTLALTLHRSGARFVTDDSLPVEGGSEPVARPGVPSLRVFAGDALAAAAYGDQVSTYAGRDGKVFLPPVPAELALTVPTRLAALYCLRSVPPDGRRIDRHRLAPFAATMRLVSQSKIAEMLGPSFAGDILARVAAISATVPVYELDIPRDLALLPAVTEQIRAWHAGGSTAA